MITRIELENFKGIRERVSLDLKPITLLFGANSSGKSTVIHALHYALEVLKNDNLDADRTTLGGESVDLGGFRNLVHGHDPERRIGMLFEFEAEGSSLPDYTEGVADTVPLPDERLAKKDLRKSGQLHLPGASFDDRIDRAWVRLEIGWSLQLRGPQVFTFEVGTSDDREHAALRIEAGTSRGQTASLLLHPEHPVFGSIVSTAAFVEGGDFGAEVAEAGEAIRPEDVSGPMRYMFPLYAQTSALPAWRRPLRFWPDDWEVNLASPPNVHIRRVASKLAVGVGGLLISKLERLLYVGPLRTVPPRTYTPPLTEDLARWAEGLGAWDALYRQGAPLVSRVSKWMQTLGMGYRLELRQVQDIEGTAVENLQELLGVFRLVVDVLQEPKAPRRGGARPHTTALPSPLEAVLAAVDALDHGMSRKVADRLRAAPEMLDAWFGELRAERPHSDLVLVDERNGVRVHLPDVGVGISQVLPVVVAALYRGERGAGAFVVVEQPELHVHPKLQVNLADLFIEQACAGSLSDHQFLLETHSEHILLRLLRRIREGSEGQAATSSARGGSGAILTKTLRGGTAGSKGRRGSTAKAGRGSTAHEADVSSVAPPTFTAAMLSVVYVQRTEDGSTRFTPLRADNTGEFLDRWPEGFFAERAEELF